MNRCTRALDVMLLWLLLLLLFQLLRCRKQERKAARVGQTFKSCDRIELPAMHL